MYRVNPQDPKILAEVGHVSYFKIIMIYSITLYLNLHNIYLRLLVDLLLTAIHCCIKTVNYQRCSKTVINLGFISIFCFMQVF